MHAEGKHIKVLHIASGDLWAGAEVQLFTLVKTLRSKADITVEIVLLNHGRLEQELRNLGTAVTVIEETKFNAIKILFQLIQLMRNSKPDVIHTHRSKENILGSIAARLSGNIPTLRTVHGAREQRIVWYHLAKQLTVSLDWLCGRFLQKKIIAVAQDLGKKLAIEYPAKKIQVITNGVDVQAICRAGKHGKIKAMTFPAPLRIAIIGRLVAVKRVDIFIQTARHLLEFYPDFKARFFIYGDGPQRAELELLNPKLKTTACVHFMGHCDHIYQPLADIDFLLITSEHEGTPMVLLEAMALQVGIIAHSVGGIPDVLDHGRCGILLQNNSAPAYAEALLTLAENPEKYLAMIKNARTRVDEKYSASCNAVNYYNEYCALTR